MIDNKTLGNRIKFFRERAKLSQFDLENSIGASNGTLSRIEKGKVNPTKETVLLIAEELNLRNTELDYLIGVTATPPTKEEIDEVIRQNQEYLERQDIIGYLSDERWLIYKFSKGIQKLLDVSDEKIKELEGQHIIDILMGDKLGMKKIFSKEEYKDLLETQIKHYFSEVGFMFDDDIIQKGISIIESNPFGKELWGSLDYKDRIKYLSEGDRQVYFKSGPFKFALRYHREPVLSNPRFQIVEYTPANQFIRIVNKLLA